MPPGRRGRSAARSRLGTMPQDQLARSERAIAVAHEIAIAGQFQAGQKDQPGHEEDRIGQPHRDGDGQGAAGAPADQRNKDAR